MFQMAAVVVFSSPFLCWPDNPETYLHSPLLQFVRRVPVVWDETRVLAGSVIGETVILARRHGEEWYVAALNCRDQERTLELDLSGLRPDGRELTVYRDGDGKLGVEIAVAAALPASGRLAVKCAAGGGAVVHLAPRREFPGWK